MLVAKDGSGRGRTRRVLTVAFSPLAGGGAHLTPGGLLALPLAPDARPEDGPATYGRGPEPEESVRA